MSLSELFRQVLKIEAEALLAAKEKITENQIQQIVNLFEILATTGGNLIISGVGKSGHVAQKIAGTFSSLGLPSFFLHPTEAMHGDLGRVTKSDVIILISKSGTTEELLQMLPYLAIPKERIISIVGHLKSPIADLSGIVLDASVEKEACLNDLAPTTSTTLALAIGDALAVIYESVMGVSKEKFAINHPAGLLGKSLSLTVDKLMIPKTSCPIVGDDALLQDVILAMTRNPVGMCAVLQGELLMGILVEGDIRRAFAKSSNALNLPISDLMTRNPICFERSTLALDALKKMETKDRLISVAPIVDSRNFLGVLRLHDLFRAGFLSSQISSKK
jgi:arabinose-5-phosphate isomerase